MRKFAAAISAAALIAVSGCAEGEGEVGEGVAAEGEGVGFGEGEGVAVGEREDEGESLIAEGEEGIVAGEGEVGE